MAPGLTRETTLLPKRDSPCFTESHWSRNLPRPSVFIAEPLRSRVLAFSGPQVSISESWTMEVGIGFHMRSHRAPELVRRCRVPGAAEGGEGREQSGEARLLLRLKLETTVLNSPFNSVLIFRERKHQQNPFYFEIT